MENQRPIRALFLTSGSRTPSTRFRIIPFLRYLNEAGIRTTVAESFPQKYDYFPWLGFRLSQRLKRVVRWWHWIRAYFQRPDVVLIERELFDNETFDLDERFRRIAPRLVLDIDDAIFQRYPDKIDRLAKMADIVVAGNSWIAQWVRPRNSNCMIIPTGIELAKFPMRPTRSSQTMPVIGWIGTVGNLRYLQVAAPALNELAKKHKFVFQIVVPELILPASVDLQGVTLQHVVWRPDTEVVALHAFDIGLMPLFEDQEWDKFKCPTKLIQYMAIGIPAVASPVGFTGEVLEPGVDGYYAANDQQWYEQLEKLLLDRVLRENIGRAARQKVATEYCVESNWPRLVTALTGNAEGTPPIASPKR